MNSSAALSIYVHYPFCNHICKFCAFNKYPLSSRRQTFNLTIYATELRHKLAEYRRSNIVESIRSVYFGGGTPSLAPELVEIVLKELTQAGLPVVNDTEVTFEANPASLSDVQMLADIGVTRISLGVQSLTSDIHLKYFNRDHTASQARYALETLVENRRLFRDGFTFDLMFNNPVVIDEVETPHDIREEIEVALPFVQSGGHLSIYELTVESGTPLASDVRRGRTVMPSEDALSNSYEALIASLHKAGLRQYEISSFAKAGMYGRHNFSFWMGCDVLNIGPGAHGRITLPDDKYRSRNILDPHRWAEQVIHKGTGEARRDGLRVSWLKELVFLGLRTEVGLSLARFKALSGSDLMGYLDRDALRRLLADGFLKHESARAPPDDIPEEFRGDYRGTSLCATPRGRAVLDLLLPELFSV